MSVWALLLEYDGTGFAGWQRQGALPTLQATLEAAAARLNQGTAPASIVAGRTDAGVHAAGQVAMLTLPDRYRADQVRDGLNFHMRPHRLIVLRAAPAPPGWNSRFSATLRRYEYRILNRRPRPALDLNRVWHVERWLDAEAMHEAAQHLVGQHDFTSFRAVACQARSPVRTIDRLDVSRQGDEVVIVAEARSFLHHQIRNIAGTLQLVGHGRMLPARLPAVLAARDRAAAGQTAPPEGLTLLKVTYEPDPFAE